MPNLKLPTHLGGPWIFLGWSGRVGRAAARMLRSNLEYVIFDANCWMSDEIQKGTRWGPAVAKALRQAHVGILCVSPDGVASQYLLFEAGALAASVDRVFPLLFKVSPQDLPDPLRQFEATEFDNRADFCKLVKDIQDFLIESQPAYAARYQKAHGLSLFDEDGRFIKRPIKFEPVSELESRSISVWKHLKSVLGER